MWIEWMAVLGGWWAVLGTTAGTAVVLVVLQRRARRLERAVRAAGLTWRDRYRADGVFDGVPVTAEAAIDGHGNRIRLEVELPRIPGAGLTIRAETLRTQLAASMGAGDLTIGDAAYDDAVWTMAGDVARARALLDGDTRARLVRAVAAGGWFERERWRLAWVPRSGGTPLQEALAALVSAHAALARPVTDAGVRRGLERVARTDRRPRVRLGALEQRLALGDVDDAVLQACERDIDPAVRLTAAAARGAAGRDTLLALLRDGSRSWRTRAAAALLPVAGEGADEVEDVLIASLADPDLAADAAAVLGAAGRIRVAGPLAAAASDASLPRATRAAIREALRAVRSRGAAHLAGGLALADDPSGVPLAGAMSAADPPGRLRAAARDAPPDDSIGCGTSDPGAPDSDAAGRSDRPAGPDRW